MMQKSLLFAISLLLSGCQPQNHQQNTHQATQHNQKNTSSTTTQNQPLKIITPDWAIASTLTAMGYPPMAVGDVKIYPDWVGKPELPSQTIDLGARSYPNPERLAQLQPDMIIDNDFYAHLRPLYGDTPHASVFFGSYGDIATWQNYAETTKKLGEIINQPKQAEAFLIESKQKLHKLGLIFRQKNPDIQKIAVVKFADANNLRIYANNSLFKPATQEMGLSLITLEDKMGQANMWGFVSITLGDLAKLDQQTCLVVVEPFSPMLYQDLSNTLLWQRLGYANNLCMTVIKPLWVYGGISSMVTFGERLNEATFQGKIANAQ